MAKNKTKIRLKQKLYILKSYTSLVFNTFSFEPRKIENIFVYREVPEILEIANRSLSPSPLPSSGNITLRSTSFVTPKSSETILILIYEKE